MSKGMKLGEGGRFAKLKASLENKGLRNPAAAAASIGAKKYGQKRMTKMAVAGKHRENK